MSGQIYEQLNIDELTADDFNTEKPYKYLASIEDPFDQEIAVRSAQNRAKAVGMTGFTKLWSAYKQRRRALSTAKPVGNVTDFTGLEKQGIEPMQSGPWICSDEAIYTPGQYGDMIACTHPIMPIERLVNIDTSETKVKVAYKRGRKWRDLVIERSLLASPQRILQLADFDVAVTSESARYLIKYLSDIEALNYESIPEKKSTTRLGWVDDNTFLPYSTNVTFDGYAAFKNIYDSVAPAGSHKKWLDIINKFRRMDAACRIAMAASFASVLLSKIDALPMFVHLWASDSGTGKTVMAMAAASVWGSPEIGKYMQTFSTTEVASEWTCAFLNSLPLIMDELQLARDKYGNIRFNPYKIAQGIGKARGTKTGGIEQTPTWCLSCITTGETPLTSVADGAGAYARIIDVELDRVVISLRDGQELVNIIKSNHGHAGRMFIKAIQGMDMSKIVKRYHELIDEIVKKGTVQSKQAMGAASLLLADELADEIIFHDEIGRLTIDELMPSLLSIDETSIEVRAYEFLEGWIASNAVRFKDSDRDIERYGLIQYGKIYIIRSVFNETLSRAGFNSRTVASAFKKSGLTETEDGRHDTRKTIDGNQCRCICIKIKEKNDNDSAYL